MNKEQELVSIIVPVYNNETFVRSAIESILAQTYKKTETIVIDDGSTDGTRNILESFKGKIKVVTQDNQGAAAARNLGAELAQGYWIAFLDSDDTWLPEKLERQISEIGKRNWSYTDTQFMGGANDGLKDSQFTKKHEGNVLRKLVQGNFISTSTVMIKSCVFKESGGFDISLRSIQDWELWTRISEKHEIAYINEPLVHYRVHSASISRNTQKTLPNHLKVIDTIFSRAGSDPDVRKLKPYSIANSYGICSHISEEEGDWKFAIQCAVKACQKNPKNKSRWTRLVKVSAKAFLFFLKNKNASANRPE